MRIGFIGLGIMGTPMAGHLISGDHALAVHSRSKIPAAICDAGARICANGAEVAAVSELIFIMVPDTPDVEKVLFGEAGVASGLSSGKVVVDMSSISPIATRRFASRIESLGCDYLDAPVSGGELGAKSASLTIMVGGRTEIFEYLKPIFALMGRSITLVGNVGAGQVAKVANQMIVALNIIAVAEALVFASKAGVNPERVRQALMGGFAASRILELHGDRMVKRAFNPGFRVALHRKDLGLALQSARELGMTLPQTADAEQLMQVMQAEGWDQLDHSALVKTIEKMSNHELSGKGAEG